MSKQMLPQRPLPDGLVLSQGAHKDVPHGMCVMEAVAYASGERHSALPTCASPTIAAFLRLWNDAIRTDADRTRLLGGLVTRIIDSRSTPGVEMRRSYLAFDWFVHTNLVTWISRGRSVMPYAATLRSLGPLVTADAVNAASGLIQKAMKNSSTDRVAARVAAGDAAWYAARAALRDAARSAAMVAGGGHASWYAAWAVTRAAAWDTAMSESRHLAARDAEPTVSALEASALDLIDRMLAVTPESLEATSNG